MPGPVLVPPVRPPRPALAGERQLRLRLTLLALGVGLWAVCVGVRLFHLQVLERADFQRLAARQSERTLTIAPRRGAILDRNGRALAVSVEAESLYAVPQDVSDPEGTAAALAPVLRLEPREKRELVAQLRRSRAFVWVRRKVDPATARAVRDLQLDGIGFLAESRRYYPKRELAAPLLGYVGLDNTGMGGIEYAFDGEMRGRAAKVVVRTDARRRPVGQADRPSTEGRTVRLTVDETLQHLAERELRRSVAETRSVSGLAVMLEPHTGEVLALASEPGFNSNSFADYPGARRVNRAVADAYEPGSIFKIVTAAAGLQEKVVEPEEVLDCGHGTIEIAGVSINDHAVFDKLSFRMAVAKSSDIGMIRVAQRLGREQFARYVRDFGFGTPTGVELPGESSGLFRPTAKWSAISLASLSFGQEVGVTALQMAMAASAVANGGYLMKPLVVRRVEDRDGRVVKESKPLAVRRVLQPETVDVLTDLLKGVVREGTGRHAAIPGYVVAGKTGTAQKIEPSGRYSMVDHVASFVGFAPASHPALVVLVSLDTPKGPHNEGGDVAAPVFARVMEQALRHRAVPSDDPERVLRATPVRPESVIHAAYRPGASGVDAGRFTTPPGKTEDADPRIMPDLRGTSAREAALAAARRGLIVELKGSGRVVAQTPEPGSEIEPGQSCELSLSRGKDAPGPGPSGEARP